MREMKYERFGGKPGTRAPCAPLNPAPMRSAAASTVAACLYHSLPQTVLSSGLGSRHSSSLKLSLLSLLTNTLPGPSASEVMTLRRYTNLFIIIIIIIRCFNQTLNSL